METCRKISRIIRGQATSDGAGVRLTRIFGFYEQGMLDPFLMLDFFGSNKPDDYIAGFPWHPHRGIETVTYMLDGKVEHSDSLGNSGVIGKGDVQWMTAGSGIIHQEMPQNLGGRMGGFQLWVNLPAANKMMPPRYQDIPAHKIPEVIMPGGVRVKVIAGTFGGVFGPVQNIIADPVYIEVEMAENSELSVPVNPDYTVFLYLFEGEANLDERRAELLRAGTGALFGKGSFVNISTGGTGARFILISGKPIGEPIAWRGPIVMNTEAELNIAFRELKENNFIK
jgi:redox-sensitive bicupin YhaK (pirin superfamily)